MPTKPTAEEVKDPSAAAETTSDTSHCRTVPLVAAFSICLTKHRFCKHAMSFGHQILCRHPDHAKFAANSNHKK